MKLTDLDSVDWGAFTHAYGPATDVPDLIRRLASTDKKTSEAAFGVLITNIHHQGTVFEASVQAMPFLVELLATTEATQRELVAGLVASLLAGKGYCQVHWTEPMIDPFTRKPMATPPPNLAELLAAEERIVSGVLERGRPAIPLLLPFLEHEDAFFRTAAAKALCRYPGDAESIAPALRRALAAENDEHARKAITNAIQEVLGEPVVETLPDAGAILEKWLTPWVAADAQMIRRLTFDARTMSRVATAMVSCVIRDVMTLPKPLLRKPPTMEVLASLDPFESIESAQAMRDALRALGMPGAVALSGLASALQVRDSATPKARSQAWFNLFGGPNLGLAVTKTQQAGADRARIAAAITKTLRALCAELTPN